MKNVHSVYKVNKFVEVEENVIFTMLKKYFEYGRDFDYTNKAKECVLQLNEELSYDKALLNLLEQQKFVKIG